MIGLKEKEIYKQYMYSYPHKTSYRKFPEISLEDYKDKLEYQENSLYFHIPFCESKCGYCNLFSVTGKSKDYMFTYLSACRRQAKQYNMKDISFSDLVVGGGTPLLLPEEQLTELFSISREYFDLKEDANIVIETAPNQTTREKIAILKENKVTRVSIGVQSFCQQELNHLLRHHSVEQARNAIKMLKEADFPCLNIDLIYGIKGQTMESLKRSLEEACFYKPDEIYIYPLYVKPGTILDLKQERASAQRYDFYCFIRDFLNKNGYIQTSMRRFALSKTKDNTSGCGFENTISIGCGGRSYIGNLHFCTPYSVSQNNCRKILDSYIQREDYTKISYGYILSEEEIRRRYVIKNLLYSTGIYKKDYEQIFQSNIFTDYPQLQNFLEEQYIISDETRIYLSKEGLALSDYIGPTLISDEIRKRMDEWNEMAIFSDVLLGE